MQLRANIQALCTVDLRSREQREEKTGFSKGEMPLGAHMEKCFPGARDSLVPPGGGKYRQKQSSDNSTMAQSSHFTKDGFQQTKFPLPTILFHRAANAFLTGQLLLEITATPCSSEKQHKNLTNATSKRLYTAKRFTATAGA